MGKKRLGRPSKATGKRVRELRLARALTQAQLAGDDFTKGFISLVETGRSRMSSASAELIAARLRVPVSVLLDEREQLHLRDARAALERALDLCAEMERYAATRRALITAALEQFDSWRERQRELRERVRAETTAAPRDAGSTKAKRRGTEQAGGR